MARYSAELLAPLHARLEALASENGTLHERVRHLEQRVAEYEAVAADPEREHGAAARDTGRPRWRFW